MSMTQSGRLDLSSNNASEITGGDTSTFTQVVFPTPFPANSQVIVLTQVQTFRGPDTPGVRIHDVNVNGFKIRLNELVGSGGALADGRHTAETIGWVATTVSG
ncbi:hypothetical protein AB0N99_26995 [Streptomyces sp. NPDC093272]|jgi:hypothetical protein|uniref:hypothetical protein n=1 Tax=unclassified Streptomyces TaxID=2593676 RepID=UPI00332DB99D